MTPTLILKRVSSCPSGEDIRELFLDVTLLTKGESVLSYSYPICEEELPRFSFCGRRRGGKCPARCSLGPGDLR